MTFIFNFQPFSLIGAGANVNNLRRISKVTFLLSWLRLVTQSCFNWTFKGNLYGKSETDFTELYCHLWFNIIFWLLVKHCLVDLTETIKLSYNLPVFFSFLPTIFQTRRMNKVIWMKCSERFRDFSFKCC